MSNAAALREETFVDQTAPPPNRDEVLARYFRLREISKRHNDNVMKFLGKGAIFNYASRLGLTYGKILVADSMDHLTLAADLAIHTAPPDRSRAIDRYARSANLPRGSEDAAVLEAMRNARFGLLVVRQRHPSVGLIVTDVCRDARSLVGRREVWKPRCRTEPASRADTLRPVRFVMTAGIAIPLGSRANSPELSTPSRN